MKIAWKAWLEYATGAVVGLSLVAVAGSAFVLGVAAALADGMAEARRTHAISAAIWTTDPRLAAPRVRLAQGSTGGTLGKTDQSLSGGQPKETLPEKTPGPKRPKQEAADGAAAASVLGRWRWTAHCPISGTLTGTLALSGSPQHLSGTIQQDVPAAHFSITGHVSGRTVVFSHPLGALVVTWNTTLSGSGRSAQIIGRSGHQFESCSVSATRA